MSNNKENEEKESIKNLCDNKYNFLCAYMATIIGVSQTFFSYTSCPQQIVLKFGLSVYISI